jgi:hypothetical protein
MSSLEKDFIAALSAAGKKAPVPKRPCPAHRLVRDGDGRLRCTTRGEVTHVRVGSTTVTVNSRGQILSPADLKGGDASGLMRLAEGIKAHVDCARVEERLKGITFPSKRAAINAIRKANPRLAVNLSRLRTKMDTAFEKWEQNRMRGPRPTDDTGVRGEFDWVRPFVDRKGGARKIYSWTEALYAIVPRSRRWDDFAENLNAAREAMNKEAASDPHLKTVGNIEIPGTAGKAIRRRDELAAMCRAHPPEEVADLLEEFRAAGPDTEDAPF